MKQLGARGKRTNDRRARPAAVLAAAVAILSGTAGIARAEDGTLAGQTTPGAQTTPETQNKPGAAPDTSTPSQSAQQAQGAQEAPTPLGAAATSSTPTSAEPTPAAATVSGSSESPAATSPAAGHMAGQGAASDPSGTGITPVDTGATSAVPVSTSPEQETVSSADSTIDNGAAVGQTAGQVQQGQGQSQGQGQGAGSGNGDGGPPSNSQQAGTHQGAGSNASAASNGASNNAAGARVGASGAGDQGGIQQANTAAAAAEATNTQTTGQSTGATTPTGGEATAAASQVGTNPQSTSGSQSGGQQGATAVAEASATDSRNTIVLVRIDAPGDDAGFDQSNTATAAATAANNAGAPSGGATAPGAGGATPVEQSSQATASATLERPSNVAVELRIGSDGNSAGGSQRNEANAGASAANASPVATQAAAPGSAVAEATTAVSDPQNTFVSIRVNSDGETGTVAQGTTQAATETVAGEVTSTVASADPADGIWTGQSADGAIAVSFASDGDNTDVRLEVDVAGLLEPTAGSTFVWTWDLVFGPGLEPVCTIGSEASSAQTSWIFDCDPENKVTQKNVVSPATPAVGSLSWTWNWERGDLPGWSWNRQDLLPLLTCPTCTYVFNFNWISFEPVELDPSGSTPSEKTSTGPTSAPAISQTSSVSAEALAANSSSVVQVVEQTQAAEGVSSQLQNSVQVAAVEQDTLSRAVARLFDTLNQSIALGGRIAQEATATAKASASADTRIAQWTVQSQQGSDEADQGQLAIQSATVRQDVDAIGAASLRDAINSALVQAANVTQAVAVLGSAGGTAASSTRQSTEQLQAGADSEQLQVSGQWDTVDQGLELVAAAVLERATNESDATGDTSSQTIGARSSARGSSASATSQGVFQSQSGDSAIQSQEAYQVATIVQTGSAAAGTSAGAIVHRYATPPAGTEPAASSAQAEPAVDAVAVVQTVAAAEIVETATAATAPAVVPALVVPAPTTTAPIFLPARGALARVGGAPRIDAMPATHAAPVGSPIETPPLPSRLSSVFTQVSSSPAAAGRAIRHVAAATASIEAGSDENEVAGGSRRPTSAPAPSGASAGSAGTTSGGALAALAALFVLVAPGLGRRLQSQIGKRSAVFMLLDTRPG